MSDNISFSDFIILEYCLFQVNVKIKVLENKSI